MKTLLSLPRAARFGRLLAVVLVSVVCLSGSDCGGGNSSSGSDTNNPPLQGTDTTTAPPASAQDTLISLINSQVRSGKTPLTTDSIATSVAQAHSDYMLSTGMLTEVMNGQTFSSRLIAAGATAPVNDTDVVAKGYSTPQSLVNAILANSTITSDLQGSTYTRIGVGLSGPAKGNYWTILLY